MNAASYSIQNPTVVKREVLRYSYDAFGVVSILSPGGSTCYEYDGDGTRKAKTQGGAKTKYINDVGLPLVQVLMETDNTGAVQAIYNYGNDLISMNRANANSYYHYDGLGTVRELTGDSGTVDANYTYDSFGNLIASSGTVANPYGFTGEQQFGEADSLVFLRARYYKPSIGRFISRDQIGYEGDGLNLYTYCKNNPINLVDQDGLSARDWWRESRLRRFLRWLISVFTNSCGPPGCDAGECCLRGCTAIYGHAKMVERMCKDPDYYGSPECNKLLGIIEKCGSGGCE